MKNWKNKHHVSHFSSPSESEKKQLIEKAKRTACWQKAKFYSLIFIIAALTAIIFPLLSIYFIYLAVRLTDRVSPLFFPLTLTIATPLILKVHFLALRYLSTFYHFTIIPYKTFAQELKDFVSSINTSFPTKSISSLRLKRKDRDAIKEILQTVASKSKTELLFTHRSRLRALEKEIKDLHPLKFLQAILSDRNILSHFKRIRQDSFKWSSFESNLEKTLSKVHKENNLLPYLASFCKETKLSFPSMLSLIEQKQFKKFIDHIVKK